jgi:hypothetical protein
MSWEEPFFVKDCVLAAIATGVKAQSLSEFRERLAVVDSGSIFYHFWHKRLDSTFEAAHAFYNDFSHWAHYCLHDDILAEQLELLNPTDYTQIEDLRTEMLEIIDDRLDEYDISPWTKQEEQFHFIRSKIVVFSTYLRADQPHELVKIVPLLSRSSIFYHFIDARRRTLEAKDDLSTWIAGFRDGNEALLERLSQIDPYFISLVDLQKKISTDINEFFLEKMKNQDQGQMV